MESLDLFCGFTWPVPRAFSDALAKCRFECGDMFYDHRSAYELSWGDAKKQLSYSIQVTFPSRAVSGSSAVDSVGLFRNNWASEIELDLTNYRSSEKNSIRTRQGNLYKMLRDGDLSLLDPQLALSVPMTSAEMNRELDTLEFDKSRESQFLLPYDETSELLRAKRSKIEDALGQKSSITAYPAYELKEFSGRDILPTLKVVVFNIDLQPDEVEGLIKDAVYVPLKNKKTDQERFRLRDHGLLR